MILHGYEVDRGKIQDYFTTEILKCIEFYMSYREMGNPYDVGWIKWPCQGLDIIKALKIEEARLKNGR